MLPAESSSVGGKCVVLSTTFGSHQDEFLLAPTLRRIVVPVPRSILRTYWVLLRCFRRDKVALANGSLRFRNLRGNSGQFENLIRVITSLWVF